MIVHVPPDILNRLTAENDANNKEIEALAVLTEKPDCPQAVHDRMDWLRKRFIAIHHELLAAQIKPPADDSAKSS